MFLFTCETRCDETMAFPYRLRSAVLKAVALVATGEMCHAFIVNMDREELRIPYRVYYSPEVLRRELGSSQGVNKLILACLGSRHYDGYLRQDCLRELFSSDEAWLTPYIIQLSGEYVVEIADEIAKRIAERSTTTLAAFASENSVYLATLSCRAASYWSCYHRQAYPQRNDYPGAKVLAVLRNLLE